MIALPAFFLALASAAVLAALVALWSSFRGALGGGPSVVLETARDLPEHAALVDEKKSLLRAIKDLEYERSVGKIGEADFERLDAAYRARAKEVLAALDRDVRPLYARAESMIAERLEREGVEPVAPTPIETPPPAAEPPSLDTILAGIRDGSIAERPAPPAAWPADARKLFEDAVERAFAERGEK